MVSLDSIFFRPVFLTPATSNGNNDKPGGGGSSDHNDNGSNNDTPGFHPIGENATLSVEETTEETTEETMEATTEETMDVTEEATTEAATEATEAVESLATEETIPEETEEVVACTCTVFSKECITHCGLPYFGLGLAIAFFISWLICCFRNMQRRKKQEERRRRRKEQAAHHEAPVEMPSGYTTMGEGVTSVGAVAAGATLPLAGVRAMGFQGLGARNDQQDSFGVSNVNNYASQGVMAVVADGMGGLANGKAVSAALVNTFQGSFNESAAMARPQDVLLNLALRSNNQVNQMLQNADRSGSTLVSALVRGGMLHFLTVGDSRIYLYRNGALLQLNREHIYQEELAVKAVNYQVPVSQVTSDRQAHSLTSYFGIGVLPHVDRNDEGVKLVPGDRIFLCTDGVFGTLSREQMEQALRLDLTEAAASMKEMIAAAGKPHQDNNTGLILEFLG